MHQSSQGITFSTNIWLLLTFNGEPVALSNTGGYYWPALFFHTRQSHALMDYRCRIHVRSHFIYIYLFFFLHSDRNFNLADGSGSRNPAICHETNMCRLTKQTANNYQNYPEWREVPGSFPLLCLMHVMDNRLSKSTSCSFCSCDGGGVDKDTTAASSGTVIKTSASQTSLASQLLSIRSFAWQNGPQEDKQPCSMEKRWAHFNYNL